MTAQLDTLTQQFFNASKLPAEPAIPEFAVRRDSSMGKLQAAFGRAGVTYHTGRKSLFICTPSNDQKRQMQREGIDIHTRQFKCSPRRG